MAQPACVTGRSERAAGDAEPFWSGLQATPMPGRVEVVPGAVLHWQQHRQSSIWSLCVPLSEDEQRILLEIEKDFYDNDPDFAREVSETTLTRHALRNIRWAVLGGVLGLVGIGLGLQVHFALSFAAFLVVFASAVVIERNVRKMGRLGLEKVSDSIAKRTRPRDADSFGDRMRRRFRNDSS